MIASVVVRLREPDVGRAVPGRAGLLIAAHNRASAADCPGHPDALGTSRTLVVDPREYPIIGTMQYAKTLPLGRSRGGADVRRRSAAEIQLPDSGHSRRPMRQGDLLSGRRTGQSQSGRRAQGSRCRPHRCHPHPEPSVEHAADADRSRAERRSTTASRRSRQRLATAPRPRRSSAFPASPATTPSRPSRNPRASRSGAPIFRPTTGGMISPQRVYDLAIQRLEAKGKGILLLHDIQPRTVAALPRILQTLKARGYRIVHVVPATPERPATPTEPQQWQMQPDHRDGGDLALAENSEFRLCRHGSTSRPALVRFRLARRRARHVDAPHARRAAGAADAVAAANGSGAGQRRDGVAGSGREPVPDSGIDRGHDAGRPCVAPNKRRRRRLKRKPLPSRLRCGPANRAGRRAVLWCGRRTADRPSQAGRAPDPACGRNAGMAPPSRRRKAKRIRARSA